MLISTDRLRARKVAHRITNARHCTSHEVIHCESEVPAMDDRDLDDGTTVIVSLDDDPEWWTSDASAASLPECSAVVTRHEIRTMTRSA